MRELGSEVQWVGILLAVKSTEAHHLQKRAEQVARLVSWFCQIKADITTIDCLNRLFELNRCISIIMYYNVFHSTNAAPLLIMQAESVDVQL